MTRELPRFRLWLAAALGVVAVFLIVGFWLNRAGALAPAGGYVRFRDGRPVPSGIVEFAPEPDGPAARGRIRPDGRYDLETEGKPGAAPGRYRVAVIQISGGGHVHKGFVVDPAFARFETSGLRGEVVLGQPNEIDLEVGLPR